MPNDQSNSQATQDLDGQPPQGDAPPQESQTDFEAEARKMGWREKSAFKGDPANWVDAETFYTRGREVLPIVKAENSALRAELARMKGDMASFQSVLQRSHDKEVADLRAELDLVKAARKEAIKTGDGDAFEDADARAKTLETAIAGAKPPASTAAPQPDAVFVQWAQENTWLVNDPELVAYAERLGATKYKHLQGKGIEFYEAVAKDVKKFDNFNKGIDDGSNRPGPQRGGRGNDGDRPGQRPGTRSYENLLPEYRQNCDRQFKDYQVSGKIEAWRERYVKGCTDDCFKGR